MSALSNVIGAAKSGFTTGKGSLNASLNSLVSGDIQGALANLANTAGDTLNAFAATGAAPLGDGFGGINAREDALQNWCWYAMLPAFGRTTLPWYYVSAANMPYRTIQTEAIQRNGKAVHYPESYSVDNLSMVFFLDNSGKAYQYLKTWQGLVLGNIDPKKPGNQGKWGLPSNYKKDIQLIVFSVAKKRMLNVKYINCWPTNLTALSLSSGQAEALSQEVNFLVEDVEVTVNNDKGLMENLLDTTTNFVIGNAANALTGFGDQQLNNLFA